MRDIIIDTLLDSLKLIPFLLLAFFIIELIEHKFSAKTKKTIAKSNKFGPLIGSLLGAIPQCGFSVVATNLYVTRIVSLGTLISIYLSTSDEMIPILLSNNMPIGSVMQIVLIKVVIGFIFGMLIDLVYHRHPKSNFHICEDTNCNCEESLLKSTIIHTLKTLAFITLFTFIINILFSYFKEDVIARLFLANSVFGSFLTAILGLIPSCGASIMIASLYVHGVISYGSLIGGLLTGSGVAVMVLFKTNKNVKENLAILSILYFIGAFIGILIDSLLLLT